jgi:hypothetical protein
MKAAFVLFLMFFTSPPAKPGKQVWTLNSTTHFEFETMEACIGFGQHIWGDFKDTKTTTLRGWCVNQATGESTLDLKPGQTNSNYFDIGPGMPMPPTPPPPSPPPSGPAR